MKWINADDRLPEKGCNVIVFNCMSVNTAGWDNLEDRFFIGCSYLNGVTHWMPLPSGPKDLKQHDIALLNKLRGKFINSNHSCEHELLDMINSLELEK